MGTSGSFGASGSHLQCTAKSKRSGERCKGIAVKDSPTQKCRMHGGCAPHGPAASNFVHGRHSKYLPARLGEIYDEAVQNPDLIELADHIALLESKIKEILVEAAEEPIPRWSNIRDTFADIETGVLSGDMDTAIAAIDRMHKLLDAGVKWDTSWGQVLENMDQLRKLTDTEVKRKKDLGQMVPVDRVVALMAAVGQAVKRHVSNPAEIEKVYADLATLHTGQHAPGNVSRPLVGAVVDVEAAEVTEAAEEEAMA